MFWPTTVTSAAPKASLVPSYRFNTEKFGAALSCASKPVAVGVNCTTWNVGGETVTVTLAVVVDDVYYGSGFFLNEGLFDALSELRDVSRVRSPIEFFELSAEFAWQQAERSLRTFGELGDEVSRCWLEVFKTAGESPIEATRDRAAH